MFAIQSLFIQVVSHLNVYPKKVIKLKGYHIICLHLTDRQSRCLPFFQTMPCEYIHIEYSMKLTMFVSNQLPKWTAQNEQTDPPCHGIGAPAIHRTTHNHIDSTNALIGIVCLSACATENLICILLTSPPSPAQTWLYDTSSAIP